MNQIENIHCTKPPMYNSIFYLRTHWNPYNEANEELMALLHCPFCSVGACVVGCYISEKLLLHTSTASCA